MEKYWEKINDLHMVFIDVEKLLIESKEVAWWFYRRKMYLVGMLIKVPNY